jgi:hypothetical protein
VLGAGERIFGETSDGQPRRLVNARTVGDGLGLMTYNLVGDAQLVGLDSSSGHAYLTT